MSDTKNPRLGECLLCHASLPKALATRHVKTCLKARPSPSGPRVKALHVRVEGRFAPDYWMHIEIADSLTLYELDDFLRRTWLDCCHHMSRFTIRDESYEYESFGDSRWAPPEKTMDVELHEAIPPGTVFAHEYDYGSTTELVLRSMGMHEAALGQAGVRILARNRPIEVPCAECGKPATVVEAGWHGLNPDRCFCKRCAATQFDDEGMSLPIVNSPRVGVCAYCG